MRCDFCKFSNPPGVAWCQGCGARLLGIVCVRCYFENPPDHEYCGRCGQVLTVARDPERRGRVYERVPTSVVSVVGFGAILAVASVAYPWYLVGNQANIREAPGSIFHQLVVGWEWFPGVPLLLIILSTIIATVLAILANRGKVHPAPCLLLGLVGLLSAIWLWQGLVTGTPNPSDWEIAPMLATIGAIIVLVGGSMTARPLLRR